MRHLVTSLSLLRIFLHALTHDTASASEFHLEGHYLIGGLFDVHHVSEDLYHDRPEAIQCSSKPFRLSSYRRFQLMRFAVEQINNSTDLLPNLSLGYEIFDHCSDTRNFPGVLNLMSINNFIRPWGKPGKNLSSVIAVVGPITSTQALTVTPLFMTSLIPMVSYGSSTSVFSENAKYPSFLRTVHPNADVIEVLVNLLSHFNWRWVAFLSSDNDYGKDGLEQFINKVKDTDICLAYNKAVVKDTDYSPIFKQIETLSIHVIVVFVPELIAVPLIRSAIQLNVTNKVWLAGEGWSLNKDLQEEKEIRNIGTVLGVAQPVTSIPGFSDFMYSTANQPLCGHGGHLGFCNQACNCDRCAEDIQNADPSYSFPVYSAVYAIAHALHNTLQCGTGRCKSNITLYPHEVLAELKKSNFTLLNQQIHFNENGDPTFGSYSIVFWNLKGETQEVGFYLFHPSAHFFINDSEINWHTNGEVPVSLCSQECSVGFAMKHNGIRKCCFSCEICPNGTYINTTEDPYSCVSCSEAEWSAEGSTSCSLRLVEFVPFSDAGAIVIMVAAWVLVGLAVGVSALFAINYNTPVVRSAGGPMCFLILGCLSLCSLSVFSHFGQPTLSFCLLRFLPFVLFYTVCLACFVVRSFQIVCVFKMAAKFPRLYSWWMKYHGQWLIIAVAFGVQLLFLVIGYVCHPPHPYNETAWYPQQIILSCSFNFQAWSAPLILLLSLGVLCFIFSYVGKDLPKNYNEAKSITFCLLLLILTWIICTTAYMLYRGKFIQMIGALAIVSSLYSFLLWYFVPKCLIIIFQPQKNTQQYFKGLIQDYTKTISQ